MDTNLGQVVLVKDINPDGSSSPHNNGSSSPDSLVEFKDKLYFAANDGETGRALFVSDGSTEGTQLVKDIYPENNSQSRFYFRNLSNLTEFNDKLYFASDNGESGKELFVSDGTAEGTQLAVDLNPGEDQYGNKNASSPHYLAEFDGKLYFTASDNVHGNELFVSDGTAVGTQLVADIYPGEFPSSSYDYSRQFDDFYTRNLLEFDGKLYFAANDGVHGNELFVSDGTAVGTQLVADIYPGEDQYGNKSSAPKNLVEFKDKFYFAANDGVHGNELFVSDGTAVGTQLVADLNEETNSYSSGPSDLVEFNDKLYFAAYDGESTELYVSDGTAEGTQLLYPGKDQDGNGHVWDPDNLVEFNDKLYFTADDGEHGNELFVSDGTAEGTQLVADLNPGKNGSYASKLTVVGDELFFAADNGETGNELFKLTLSDLGESVPIQLSGSDSLDDLLGGDGAESIQALSGQDTVDGGKGNDTIDGGDGDDRLTGNVGNDSLIGGNGNDTLTGDQGNDILDGDNGSDVLNGGNGSDRLTGGEDNDRLDGGIGNDTLDGGNGDDTFVLRVGDGSNTIVDFNLGGINGIGGDQLGLADGLQFADLSFTGNNILAGEEVLATLEAVNAEELQATDFSVI